MTPEQQAKIDAIRAKRDNESKLGAIKYPISNNVSGGISIDNITITEGKIPPSNPKVNDIWIDTN